MSNIYISESDNKKLVKIVNEYSRSTGELLESVNKLKSELSRATITSDAELSSRIVALNSSVVLKDLASGETEEWILTMPEYANPEKKRISILSPIGTGVIGFMEGDKIEWETPGGTRTLEVQKVTQNAFKASQLAGALYGLDFS